MEKFTDDRTPPIEYKLDNFENMVRAIESVDNPEEEFLKMRIPGKFENLRIQEQL